MLLPPPPSSHAANSTRMSIYTPAGFDDPKPYIYVYYEDEDEDDDGGSVSYFTACSVEDDGTISEYGKICIPSPIGEKHTYSASCNGLFYFSDYSGEVNDFLWNPTTNEVKMMSKSTTEEIKILPKGELVKPSFHVSHASLDWAMWSDNASQDCFVVRLVVYHNDKEVYDYQLDLYSLKTDSWERIPTAPHGFDELGACINGFYFCPAYDAYDESSCYILSLDLSTRTLSRIPLPRDDIRVYSVVDYNGLLSIVVYPTPIPIPPALSKYEYSLWVWRDAFWEREYVFEANEYVHPNQNHFKIGELLYFRNEDEEVMVLDQVTRKWKRLPLLDDIPFCPFLESSTIRLNNINTTSSSIFT